MTASSKGAEPARAGLFRRLFDGLRKTRDGLAAGVARLLGSARLDAATLEEVEDLLLAADVGVETTRAIVARLESLGRRTSADGPALTEALRAAMLERLQPVAVPLELPADGARPFVILVVGVNGSGKTTTIGKLAERYRASGRSVMLAAGDTFRAAAVEQLRTWALRADVSITAQETGADSASVVYDALAAATARQFDVLIADTAGRLHTQDHLMDELAKVKRVLAKIDPAAPHETLLVLDASMGQNALAQARHFHDAVGVTGIVLTKLDGTAKGGIVFALASQLGVPLRYIGVGEQAADLRPFEAAEFVEALLATEPPRADTSAGAS